MWIWQQPAWPDFTWDNTVISPLLREAHFNQGLLLGRMGLENQQQATLDTLLANIVHSSAIEGEKLNAFSVRSSLAKKLGIKEEQQYPTTEQTNGLAEMMIDAITQLDQPLSLVRIPAIPDTDTVLIRTVFSFCFLCSYFYFNCPVCSSFLIDSPLNSIR